MELYKNLGGDSGVHSYQLGDHFIKVKFKSNPKVYIYNHIKPGSQHVAIMKQLAVSGHGLQTYINKHRSAGYAGTEL